MKRIGRLHLHLFCHNHDQSTPFPKKKNERNYWRHCINCINCSNLLINIIIIRRYTTIQWITSLNINKRRRDTNSESISSLFVSIHALHFLIWADNSFIVIVRNYFFSDGWNCYCVRKLCATNSLKRIICIWIVINK